MTQSVDLIGKPVRMCNYALHFGEQGKNQIKDIA